MSRARLAPDVIPALLVAWGIPRERHDRAIDQAKDLLAVARSAALLASEGRSPDRTMDDLKALRRALARLRRAGGAKP